MFNCFHNNSLAFQCVHPPKRMWTLNFGCPHWWKSLAAVGEVTDILKVFSNFVCYNTQTMPKFWVNFIYVTHLTPWFLKWLVWFLEYLWNPAILHACNSSIQKNLWKLHSLFIVCWLIAVLKIFETPNFLKCCRNVAECISYSTLK